MIAGTEHPARWIILQLLLVTSSWMETASAAAAAAAGDGSDGVVTTAETLSKRHARQALFPNVGSNNDAGRGSISGSAALAPAYFSAIPLSSNVPGGGRGGGGGGGGGDVGPCPDQQLFSYLLYYYLIQSQSGGAGGAAEQQHARVDQMAAALLRLRTARGTDPVPTLISSAPGQTALFTLLRNVAQNNPNRLLQLLGSVQQQPQQKQQQQQQRPLLPVSQQVTTTSGVYSRQSQAAARAYDLTGSFPHHVVDSGVTGGNRGNSGDGGGGSHLSSARDEVLDNQLHFSPSLRQQVYAPQPNTGGDNSNHYHYYHNQQQQQQPVGDQLPGDVRTIVRPPTTRLHVSTITTVTSLINTHATVVPMLVDGGRASSSRLVLATSTHLVTATRLQTLAVVVTPTVVLAYGRTTTLYNHDATANAEIVTDLRYSEEDERDSGGRRVSSAEAGSLVGSMAHKNVADVTVTPQLPLSPIQTVIQSLKQQAQSEDANHLGETTNNLVALESGYPDQVSASDSELTSFTTQATTTTPTTTTTEKPKSQLLELLRSRAEARRRGIPYRRSRTSSRSQKTEGSAEITQESDSIVAEDTLNRAVDDETGTPPPTTTATSTTTTTTTSTTPSVTADYFQPQQVPIYVERDGVLIIMPNINTAAAGVSDPAPVYNKPKPTEPTTPTTSATINTPVTSQPTIEATVKSQSPGGYAPFNFADIDEIVYVPEVEKQEEHDSAVSLAESQHVSGSDNVYVISADQKPEQAQAHTQSTKHAPQLFEVSYAVSTSISER